MYLKAILGYLSWPLLIIFSYQLVRWALNKFESRVALEGQPGERPGEQPEEQSGEQSGDQAAAQSIE